MHQTLSVTATASVPSFAPAEVLQKIGPQEIDIPVRLSNLPPFNVIANQVLALASDPDVDMHRLSRLMESDPAFAADVLFIANSPLFGLPSRIQVVRHAVAVVGLERLKSLAVTVAMRSFLGKGGPLISSCWRHSVASAVIAREIAASFHITPETAFTMCLMHDVGRLGLLKSCPSEYGAVLGGCFESAEEVIRTERTTLRVDHGTAGAWLARSWSLPQTFIDTCEHHHDELRPSDPELLQVVKISCRFADALGFSAIQMSSPERYETITASLPATVRREAIPSETDLLRKIDGRLKSVS